MKKIKYLTLMLLLFMIKNNDVNAICRDSAIEPYRNEAEKIEIFYSYNDAYYVDGNKINGTYKIELKNMQDKMYAQILGMDTKFGYEEDNLVIIEGVESGIQNLAIYYEPCNERLKIIKLNLPKYNKYSDREECIGISAVELDVCDKWYPYELNESTFHYKLTEFHKKQQLKEEVQKDENKELKSIINFWENYNIYIILGIIVVISLFILIVIKRKKYSLE